MQSQRLVSQESSGASFKEAKYASKQGKPIEIGKDLEHALATCHNVKPVTMESSLVGNQVEVSNNTL